MWVAATKWKSGVSFAFVCHVHVQLFAYLQRHVTERVGLATSKSLLPQNGIFVFLRKVTFVLQEFQQDFPILRWQF